MKQKSQESLPIDMYDAARRYFLVQSTPNGDIIAFDGLGYGKVRRYEWSAEQIEKCQSLTRSNTLADDQDVQSQNSLVIGSIIENQNQ